MLLLVVAGAAFGILALGAMMPSGAPVDSMGQTVSNTTNATQQIVISLSDGVIASLAVMASVIVAVLILIVVILYFATGRR